MTWGQRLKRVFGIDVETCRACGGAVRIIIIEDSVAIENILTHLDHKAAPAEPLPFAAVSGAAAGGFVR